MNRNRNSIRPERNRTRKSRESRELQELQEPCEEFPPKKKIKIEHSEEAAKTSGQRRKTRATTDEGQRLQPVEPYSFRSALKKTYGEYCGDSTIHGVPYLHQENGVPSRLFWLVLILISLITCLIMIIDQYKRWQEQPVIISFSEEAVPVSQIPFPAITICSVTKSVKTEKIDFTRFFQYLVSQGDKVIEQPSWLTDDEFEKMRALLQVCSNDLVVNMKFPEYPPLSVEHHLNQIVPEFPKQFLRCQFNQTLGDCSPFFEKIYTEEGICYSFNTLNETEIYREDTFQYLYFEKDDHVKRRNETMNWDIANGYSEPDKYDTYPERVIGCGLRAGLNVCLEEHEKNLDFICRGPVQGFKMILHSPDDIPQVDKHFIHIPYQRDVLVLVKPQFLYTTDEIDWYSPVDRKCYYPEERPLQFFRVYNQNNCEIECLANFTLDNCGCVKFSMPRLNHTTVCDASKILCYDQAEYDFLFSEYTGRHLDKCKCLPCCYTLNYNHELSEGVFNIEKVIESLDGTFFGSKVEGAMVSRLRVNFKANQFDAFKRAELISVTDFLSNCGGLFGLFMGISALSVVELFYHFTFKLYKNMQEMKRRQVN